ncbi:lysine transporter LysE [Hahella sp. CCB-MM4]|uniref:LysE family translocator n=1 Tax=Hahella sp. (strain CCB-MM4) TaxID=1926491 RepID=UPI000B9AF683|nr:LysE family translocator [Hahella sp. CCB-MM4]OZG74818.1 lysine transporter LysE [Hahella sp. CCB-MM4]
MEILLSALLFALVSTVTPGPNNIMVMTSGLNYGVYRTLPHFFGICLGFPAMVVAVGVGLGALFEEVPMLHTVIKVVGISYLLYLAYKIATTRSGPSDTDNDRPLTFVQAAMFQWVNPKAWVMAVGAMAAFTTVNGEVLMQSLWISSAFFLVSFPCVGLWLMGGAALRNWLSEPKQLRLFNLTMASLLLLSVLPMISARMA